MGARGWAADPFLGSAGLAYLANVPFAPKTLNLKETDLDRRTVGNR